MKNLSWKGKIAARLREARGSLTQQEFADLSGISQRAISFLENKKTTSRPKPLTLVKLAFATKQDPADWFTTAEMSFPNQAERQRLYRSARVKSPQQKRSIGFHGSFLELLERARGVPIEKEIWYVQEGRFLATKIKKCFDVLLQNVQRGVRCRFFYPDPKLVSDHPAWHRHHAEDIEVLKLRAEGKQSSISAYSVNPSEFNLFLINSPLLIFWKPGGLPVEQEGFRILCVDGGNDIERAIFFEFEPDTRECIVQFLQRQF